MLVPGLAELHEEDLPAEMIHHGLEPIVRPQLRTRRANVGQKLLWAGLMQITHRRRQHHKVAGGLKVSQKNFSHRQTAFGAWASRSSAIRQPRMPFLTCSLALLQAAILR